MSSQIVQTMQEPHSRTVDGIDVRLLWHPAPHVLDVREGQRPMDVFLHPFANQARRAAAE